MAAYVRTPGSQYGGSWAGTGDRLGKIETALGLNDPNIWEKSLAAYMSHYGNTWDDVGWWGDQAATRAYLQGLGFVDPTKYGTVWDTYSKDPNFYSAAAEQAQQKASADTGMADQYHPSGGLDGLGGVLALASLGFGGAGLLGLLGEGAVGAGLGWGLDGVAGDSLASWLGSGAAGSTAGAVGGADWMSEIAAGAGNGGATLPSYVSNAGNVANTWGVGSSNIPTEGLSNIITGETGPTLTGGNSPLTGNLGENATTAASGSGNLGTGANSWMPDLSNLPMGNAPGEASGLMTQGTGSSGGFTDWLKNLFSPTSSGGGGLNSSSPAGSILGALGNYLGGSQTADAYKQLQQSLLQAGDVSQRPGAQWALGQAQKYVGPQGQADYINGFANPIMNSYAQRIPSAVAKSGDLTGAMNKSMTDMGAAISGNYNGFINSLLGATGTTQPNAGIAAAEKAGGVGINTQNTANSGIYGTLGNIAGNAMNNIFNTPTVSGTTIVSS